MMTLVQLPVLYVELLRKQQLFFSTLSLLGWISNAIWDRVKKTIWFPVRKTFILSIKFLPCIILVPPHPTLGYIFFVLFVLPKNALYAINVLTKCCWTCMNAYFFLSHPLIIFTERMYCYYTTNMKYDWILPNNEMKRYFSIEDIE